MRFPKQIWARLAKCKQDAAQGQRYAEAVKRLANDSDAELLVEDLYLRFAPLHTPRAGDATPNRTEYQAGYQDGAESVIHYLASVILKEE